MKSIYEKLRDNGINHLMVNGIEVKSKDDVFVSASVGVWADPIADKEEAKAEVLENISILKSLADVNNHDDEVIAIIGDKFVNEDWVELDRIIRDEALIDVADDIINGIAARKEAIKYIEMAQTGLKGIMSLMDRDDCPYFEMLEKAHNEFCVCMEETVEDIEKLTWWCGGMVDALKTARL